MKMSVANKVSISSKYIVPPSTNKHRDPKLWACVLGAVLRSGCEYMYFWFRPASSGTEWFYFWFFNKLADGKRSVQLRPELWRKSPQQR